MKSKRLKILHHQQQQQKKNLLSKHTKGLLLVLRLNNSLKIYLLDLTEPFFLLRLRKILLEHVKTDIRDLVFLSSCGSNGIQVVGDLSGGGEIKATNRDIEFFGDLDVRAPCLEERGKKGGQEKKQKKRNRRKRKKKTEGLGLVLSITTLSLFLNASRA